MRLQNLLSFDVKTFALDVFNFLKGHLGSTIMAWVTIGIIGALSISLLICVIIAIINPIKRKRNSLNKTLSRQQEFDNARERLIIVVEEIATTNLEIRMLTKQLDDDIFNLSEIDRIALEQDELYIDNKEQEIGDLIERQELLRVVLDQKEKGIRKIIQKDKIECAKILISEFRKQQEEYKNEIAWKKANIEKRKVQLDLDIQALKNEYTAKIKSLNAKLRSYENEEAHLETKIARMSKNGRHRLTILDAKTMIDEYSRQVKQYDKAIEDLALEELQRAKEEYETAKGLRLIAEKNRALAVENVKTTRKEKLKTKHKKRDKRAKKTETPTITNDKVEDVEIIVADVNNGEILTPVAKEQPVEQIVTVVEEKVEHVYNEPTVGVVDFNNLLDEEVVYVEAFLDYLNAETEERLEEVATTEDAVEEKIEIEQTPADNSVSKECEIVAPTPEISVEESNNIEIDVTPSGAVTNEIEDIDSEAKPNKNYPAYKDYNDGIPATPIYMKSKFQKPVTKLVKKVKPIQQNEEQNVTDNTSTVKTGYNGKWKIEEADGKYLAKLLASNGGQLLCTTTYTSVNGVKECIEKVKDSLLHNRYAIASDKEEKYFFKVLSTSERTILQSAKYSSKYQCEKAIASAKKFAQTAIIL